MLVFYVAKVIVQQFIIKFNSKWVITESFIATVRNNIRLLLRKMWFQNTYSLFMKIGKPCFEHVNVLKTSMAVPQN